MNMLIYQSGNNPYLNNPRACLKAPQTQITHEGKLYTKLSYELIINTATRLIKIIQALAITILSCFVALAFQSIRKLWQEGIKGTESVDVLLPQSFSECTDIWMVIASSLSVKDLLAFRKTSIHKRIIAEKTLINHLNAGIITPGDLRLTNVTSLIDYFGENCSEITNLDLQNFQRITDKDIENLSKNFTKLKHLLLKENPITNQSAVHLAKMTLLTSLRLSLCQHIRDFSFLEQLKELTSLNLSFSIHNDFSIIEQCNKLTSLSLSGCYQITDFSFLEHCNELTSLELLGCRQINDMSVLEHCKELTSLNLSGCDQINDFSFLEHCKELRSLNLSKCDQINEMSQLLRNRGVLVVFVQ